MPSIEYQIKYRKNSGLLLSVKELKDKYLFGIQIRDQSGVSYSDDSLEFFIKSAQDGLEEYLNIKFDRQVYEEDLHFLNDDWRHWGYIKCTYPVVCPISLEGFLNTTKQVTYPTEWLSVKKESDGKLYHRNLYVVPAGQDSTAITSSVVFSGVLPEIGYNGARSIPNYWKVRYVTGFDALPYDIVDIIGKIATISTFNIAGDLVLGAGIASFSLGIDGLSQSINTTSSAENAAYSARIKQYLSELKKDLPIIRQRYIGISWGVA